MTFVIDGEVIKFARGLLFASDADPAKLAKIPAEYPVLDDDDRIVNPPSTEVIGNTPNLGFSGTQKRSKPESRGKIPDKEIEV